MTESQMRGDWRVLPVTLAIQSAISMASLTIPVLASEAAPELGLRASAVGILVGIVYGGAMVTSLLASGVIDRWGPIRASQGALFLGGAGLLIALTGFIPALLAGAALIGLGYGVVTPASSHMLKRSTPPHRMSLIFSLKQTGVPLGGALAGLLLPPLIGPFGWREAALVPVLFCLISAALAQLLRLALDDERSAAARLVPNLRQTGLFLILSRAPLRQLALASLGMAAIQLVLTSYLVVFLREEHGTTLATAGLVLALAQGAGVAGRIAWGWMADRFIAPRAMLACLVLTMAVCAGLFGLSAEDWPLALMSLISAVFGATAIGWNGVYLAEVARLTDRREAAAATGGALFVTYTGVVIGPPVYALLIGHMSYGAAFLAFGAMLAALAVTLAAGRPQPTAR